MKDSTLKILTAQLHIVAYKLEICGNFNQIPEPLMLELQDIIRDICRRVTK